MAYSCIAIQATVQQKYKSCSDYAASITAAFRAESAQHCDALVFLITVGITST
jgi:hypothetical protein